MTNSENTPEGSAPTEEALRKEPQREPTAGDLQAQALTFHERGANLVALQPPEDGSKGVPLHKWTHWRKKRQSEQFVRSRAWKDAAGLSAISGPGGWRCLDFDDAATDAAVREALDALGLPEDYRWVVRSGSGQGFHIWFRCEDELLTAALGEDGASEKQIRYDWPGKEGMAVDHVELRWWGMQTILPPSLHESGRRYRWRGERPEGPPAKVSAGHVVTAFFAVAEKPEKSEGGAAPTAAADNATRRSEGPRGGHRQSRSPGPGGLDKEELERRLSPSDRRRCFRDLGFQAERWKADGKGFVTDVLGPKELGEGETPNFSLNLETGSVKDFGSGGYTGDLYGAVQDVQRCSFPEALTWIAGRAGVDVPEPGSARGPSGAQSRRAGDSEGFTLAEFKSALEDLTGAQMCARAFDLIEECAAFDDADMARARHYLLQRGFAERDFDQWKQGVNGEKKKRRKKKKERKRRRIEARKEEQRREIEAGDVPRVELSDRHTRDVIRDVLDALRTYNETPRLFLRDGVPVQIQTNEEGTPRIVELTEAALSDHISRAASVTRTTRKRVKPADLPARYVQQILSRDDLPFPPLKGLTEVPVMRPNGTVLSDPGYDKETALYYKPAPGLHVEDVPDAPTEKQVKEALHELKEPLWDFPFTSEADYANMLALLLTPAVRPLIEGGNVPLAGIDAPTRGTGKSLLAEVFSLATTGRPIATMKAPKREEEWRKQITAQLIGGAQSVCLDNVKGKLKSTALEQALTSSVWQDRVLGKSEMTTVPQNATWLATGNNLRPAEDMMRRCYLIRIDAEQERPWQGRSFRHENLRGYVRENRGRIVHAMLVLARAWVSAGRPAPSVEPLGSFEEWTKAVGGILETAGVPDFLGNLHELWDTANPEETLWGDLLEALDGHYEGNAFTTKELASLLKSEYADGDFIERKSVRRIINALPERVLDKLHAGKARGAISRSLGNFFRNRKGRRFGPERWHLEEAGTRKRAKQWRAVSDPLPKSDNTENSESGESSESVPRQEEKVSHSHTHKKAVCVSEKKGSGKEQTHSPDSPDSPADAEETRTRGGDGSSSDTSTAAASGDGHAASGDGPPPPEEEPEVLWSISGQEKADMFGFELYDPDLSGDDPDGSPSSSDASPPDR